MVEHIICNWHQSHFLIFSHNVSDVAIYVSRFIALFVSLFISLFAYRQSRFSLPYLLLLVANAFFWIWILFDLVIASSPNPDTIVFAAACKIVVEMMIYVSFCLFTYVYVYKKSIHNWILVLISVPVLYTAYHINSPFLIQGIDINNCNRNIVYGFLVQGIHYIELGIIILTGLFSLHLTMLRSTLSESLKRIATTITVALFMFCLFNLTDSNQFLQTVQLGRWGFLSLPILLCVLAFILLLYESTMSQKQTLLNSRILLLLVIVFISPTVMVNDIVILKQMILITSIIILCIGYILDRASSRQANYESILKQKNTELTELNETKTEFLSFASHQLKAPLTGIKWGMNALSDTEMDSNQETIVSQVALVANQMVRTVTDFLNSAKLESGLLALNKNQIDIPIVIQKVINEFYPLAHSKNLTLKTEFPLDRISAPIDEVKIEQMLANLVDNAIKYTPTGSVLIRLSRRDMFARIEIIDSGLGLEPGESELLFQKYKRGSASSQNVTGSGIGLYLGREIVQMHGGRIYAISPGKGLGSTFIVELPIVESGIANITHLVSKKNNT